MTYCSPSRLLRTLWLGSALVLTLGGSATPALSADNKAGAVPLEVTADTALEWNQKAKTYTAKGHAEAKQGDFSVKGDLLVATYAGANNSTSDLIRVEATGHVLIQSGADQATGEKAIYDMTNGTVTLSGGRPVVTQGEHTLTADVIVATIKDQALVKAEATGAVMIASNGVDQASGDKATYTRDTNTAELIGTVKLMQGPSWIEGDYATMNLTTKVSKMTGQKNRPRVKGIFYPSAGIKK